MTSPKNSVSFWAPVAGADVAIAVGDIVIPDDDDSGNWVVATDANCGTRRAEAVALSATSGAGFGPFELQHVGTIDATISGLSTAASKSIVRRSSAGRIERIDAGDVDPDTDDVIGYAEADGRVHLFFGFPLAELVTIVGGGGGGGGAPTDAQYVTLATDTGLSDERVLTAGAGISITDGGAGGSVTIASTVTPGETNTISNTGSGAQVAKAKSGVDFPLRSIVGTSPVVATQNTDDITLSLSTVPVSKGGTGLTSLGTGLQLLRTNSGATAMEWWTLSVAAGSQLTGQVPIANGGTGLSSIGSANTVLTSNGSAASWAQIVNANVSSSAAIASSKLSPPGSSGQLIYNSSSAFAGAGNVTYDGTGLGVASGGYIGWNSPATTTGFLRLPWSASKQVIVGGSWASSSHSDIFSVTNATIQLGVAADWNLRNYGFQNDLWGYVSLNGYVGASQLTAFAIDATNGIRTALPLGGNSSSSVPFRWKRATITGATSQTLTASQYECPIIEVSSTADGQTVILPLTSGAWFAVAANTGSGANLTFKGSTGTGVTVDGSGAKPIYCDGTNYKPSVTEVGA